MKQANAAILLVELVMGREIKFRAWDNKEKEFVTEYDTGKYTGYIEFFGDGDVKAFYKNLTCHCSPDAGCGGCADEWTEAKDIELMQYTGLTDKNGVEIYEGDVVFIDREDSLTSINQIVEYNPSHGFVCARHLKAFDECDVLTPVYFGEDRVEVIGNKFENHELIEELK